MWASTFSRSVALVDVSEPAALSAGDTWRRPVRNNGDRAGHGGVVYTPTQTRVGQWHRCASGLVGPGTAENVLLYSNTLRSFQ
jgi:hypothetical protein